jgi:cysteine desulfurase
LPEEIFFTSGATESNNWLLRCLDCGSKATIVTSELEHKSVLEVVAMLGAEGHSVVKVPVTAEGEIEYAALEQLPLGPGSLVSLMAVNNEVHSILDIERVGDLCAARKAIFHSDAAQAVGHIPVDVRRMKIGAMSMSGHKIHSPKGIGALFVARELQPRLRPLILGGGQQENMRSGTVPAPLIVAMGRACALARKNMTAENQMLVGCTQRFLETLDANGIGYRMVGPSDLARRRAGCLCLSISGLDSSRMCEWIPGFVMSQASACNSRGVHSHVLRALSMDTEAAKNTFRIAFGRFNSASDAEELVRAIVRAAKERSRMSQENSGGFEIGKPSDTQPSGVSCGLQT